MHQLAHGSQQSHRRPHYQRCCHQNNGYYASGEEHYSLGDMGCVTDKNILMRIAAQTQLTSLMVFYNYFLASTQGWSRFAGCEKSHCSALEMDKLGLKVLVVDAARATSRALGALSEAMPIYRSLRQVNRWIWSVADEH